MTFYYFIVTIYSLKEFKNTYDAYAEYKVKIAALKNYLRTIGYTDETDIVVFRK